MVAGAVLADLGLAGDDWGSGVQVGFGAIEADGDEVGVAGAPARDLDHGFPILTTARSVLLYYSNGFTSTLRTPGMGSFIVRTGAGGRGGWTRARRKAPLRPHPKEILKLQPLMGPQGEGGDDSFPPAALKRLQ